MTRTHATIARLRDAETAWTRPRIAPTVRRRHRPERLVAGYTELPVATATIRQCPDGDPWCPCRDGDECHHVGDTIAELQRWVLDGFGGDS